jgi:TM2 domain-containing membrane protein YozV
MTDQQQRLMMLPGIQPDEMMYLQNLLQQMSEMQQQQFFMLYPGKRKSQQDLLLLTLIGFLGVAGIQRFVVGDIVWGILFILTLGFCGIGTIIDLINNKQMTADYNISQANQAADMVRMMTR